MKSLCVASTGSGDHRRWFILRTGEVAQQCSMISRGALVQGLHLVNSLGRGNLGLEGGPLWFQDLDKKGEFLQSVTSGLEKLHSHVEGDEFPSFSMVCVGWLHETA